MVFEGDRIQQKVRRREFYPRFATNILGSWQGF